MPTPFFPQFRPRLAPCRRRLTQTVRQASLAQLEHYLEGIFPPHLLAQADEGLNSRDRIYSLRLTFQCFLWQLLKPKTACREVVRQVQALFRLRAWARRTRTPAPIAKPAGACPKRVWNRSWRLPLV